MEQQDNNLIAQLRKIEGSKTYDPRSLDRVIKYLESDIPSGFVDLFHLEDKTKRREFWETVRKRYLAKSGKKKVDKEDFLLCREFFSLVAILKSGVDRIDKMPSFVEKAGPIPSEAVLDAGLHLRDDTTKIEEFIEIALFRLGHEHDRKSGLGILNEDRAQKSFKVLSSQWAKVPKFFDWLILYLSFRLMRILINMDLFYAMHGELPHYREFKVLAYMLWLLGRERYAPISQFAALSHGLFYGILKNCGEVFRAERNIDDLQKSVSKILEVTESKLSDATNSMVATDDDMRSLTLRIMQRFFSYYIDELSEAGRFHVVLWSLPMFKAVKEFFQSTTLFGRTGFSVLIIGETGTGKESIAKLFLKSSGDPYVPVNCAGISWNSLSKDLFEEKDDGPPLINHAGAVLLDELDKSLLDAQGGLLRFLDKPYGEYRAPGDLMTIRWNGLVIATATDRIYESIRSETFLPDLFWRFDSR
ncbi:sigma-54 factor interaction domain-containing protein, partial [Candidatus Bathyarchaeota archaeon]|nr:sigma-54 factor interaction domain-containing protein [Candidatus Bathyarchaeota archaeon]